MLTSLPAYIHDHPHCVVFGDHQRSSRRNMNKVRSEEVTVQPQEYTAAAWHAAVLQDKPALFIIATGDLTGIVGEQECYGVHCDKNGMRVGCHFDSFAAIAFLASGSKTFRTCAPTALAPKRDLNAHANERHDIDAAFCETATWYNIHMLPGHVMYLPMHW